ncbi:hypothetical protein ACHAQJ_006391 [Trichoderma viride]
MIVDVGHRFRQLPASNCPLCQIFYASRRKHELSLQQLEAKSTKPRYDKGSDEIWAYPYRGIGYRTKTSKDQPRDPILRLVVAPTEAAGQDEAPKSLPKSQRSETSPTPLGKRITTLPGEDGAAPTVTYAFPLEDEDLQHDRELLIFKDLDRPFGYIPSEIPSTFNAAKASEWLQYCQKNHVLFCKSPIPIIDNFRLINCQTLTVEPAESSREYVALSYVWGRQESPPGETVPSSIPQKNTAQIQIFQDLEQSTFPQVIKDAYCIDQNDDVAKHGQIQQMDAIYEGAALTIIAACGINDSSGLPGIGTTARRPQKVVAYEGIKFLWTKRSPEQYIKSSRWSTRGWTFQEAILSRRRLVFTEGDIYFECKTMHCRENDYQSLDALHIKNRSKIQSLLQSFCQYLTYVEEYTGRALSYETGSLNAFKGIMRMFKKRRKSLAHIEGLPFPTIDNRRGLISWFAWSLSWCHTTLCWSGPAKPKRRYDFTSWSWAGWDSKVKYTHRYCSEALDLGFNIDGLEVLFENKNGKTFKIHEYVESDAQHCKAIHLTAKDVPRSAFSYTASDSSNKGRWKIFNTEAHLFLSEGTQSEDQFAIELLDQKNWRVVYLGSLS